MKWAVGAVLLCAAAGALFLSGCGEDEGNLTCDACGYWTYLLDDGLGRFPAYSPGDEDKIAFSSRRPSATSVVDESRFEHIWVLDGQDLHRITGDEFNDLDPAWSPDGNVLAFTREMSGRFDVWTVDVTDPSAPGEPVRVTSPVNVDVEAAGPAWLEQDGEAWIVFASNGNIYRIGRWGGTPVKLIPDPSDVAGSCDLGQYVDFQPAVGADGRIAFTSIGRVEAGVLEVTGQYLDPVDSTEKEVTDAEIYLDGCGTGFNMPHTFYYLPVKPDLGTYTVTAESPTHCDVRFSYPIVVPNQKSTARLSFTDDKGWLYLWVEYGNCDVRVDGVNVSRFPGSAQVDSIVPCIQEGEHLLTVWWNEDTSVETHWTVRAGRTDSLYATVDSIYVTLPKSLSPALASRSAPAAGMRRARPVQTGLEQMWVADLAQYELLGFWSLESEFEQPCWSPDGQYVAFVSSSPTRNLWGLQVVKIDGTEAPQAIPLPGSGGSAVCGRSAYQVSWNSSGKRLAVSMGGCGADEGPQDLIIWVIDPTPFLPR